MILKIMENCIGRISTCDVHIVWSNPLKRKNQYMRQCFFWHEKQLSNCNGCDGNCSSAWPMWNRGWWPWEIYEKHGQTLGRGARPWAKGQWLCCPFFVADHSRFDDQSIFWRVYRDAYKIVPRSYELVYESLQLYINICHRGYINNTC